MPQGLDIIPVPNGDGVNVILMCSMCIIQCTHSSSQSPLPCNAIDKLVCLLLFYVLATSMVISEWVPTCGSAHSGQLNKAVRLGDQTASTMTWYHTQSHYSDTEPTSYPNYGEHLAKKWQASSFIIHCFDMALGSKPWSPAREPCALIR